jgi:hypothetical protein
VCLMGAKRRTALLRQAGLCLACAWPVPGLCLSTERPAGPSAAAQSCCLRHLAPGRAALLPPRALLAQHCSSSSVQLQQPS